MKLFFKTFFAALLAFVVGSLLCMFIFFGIIGAMLSFADTETVVTVKPNTVLRIMLDKPVEERSNNSLSGMSALSFSTESTVGLNDLKKALKKAGEDSNIKMIYMDLSHLSIGIAHLEELRDAVIKFKASGKPVIAYGDNLSTGAYYLASVADKVYLNPYGSLRLQGLSAEVMYLKSMLDKLQIDMQVIRHGKYKSAVEPFLLNKMSDENREQTLSFISSIWEHMLDHIAESRGIELKKLTALTSSGAFTMMSPAEDALSNNLVDGLMYKDELLDELVKLTGEKKEKDLKMVDVIDYSKTVKSTSTSKDKIAIVYADGDINMGKEESGITDWNFANILRGIRADSSIKAVVLRVNSPGGSVQASEIIARELALINAVKPVVVSMANYAASGGYWISMPSRLVIANPTTITGSIGVFGLFPNLEKGMKNHLGITVETAKTGISADFPSMYRPLSEPERRIFQNSIEDIYTKFITNVSVARGMDVAAIDALAQGRVWTGAQALENHLVDQLGGLDDAVEAAAALAGLEDYRLRELPVTKDFYTQLMDMLKNSMISVDGGHLMKTYKKLEKQLVQIQEPSVLARIPFDVEVY